MSNANSFLFDDDDDDDGDTMVVGEPVYAAPPEPVRTPKIAGGVRDLSVIMRLIATLPGLRIVPVGRNKIPLIKGWTDPLFWLKTKDLAAQVRAWVAEYGEPNFAFALGPRCGPDGDLVVEADNEAGEKWLREHVGATPIMTTTRHVGRPHRHYKPDIVDANSNLYRGNHVDVLGVRKIWEREALEQGFQVKVQRGREHDHDHLKFVAAEKDRAAKAIPLGPLIDIKCAGGQAMFPSSVHETGHVYAEVEPWTRETWDARPTFNPAWFPSEVWVAREKMRALSAEERGAADGRVDTTYWTAERKLSAARKYVERVPAMRTGDGSSKTFMRLATVLVRGFMLDAPVARELATYWAQSICAQEPWHRREIEHKLRQAQDHGAMEWGSFLKDRSTQPDARLEAAEREVEAIRRGLGAAPTTRDWIDLDEVELPDGFVEDNAAQQEHALVPVEPALEPSEVIEPLGYGPPGDDLVRVGDVLVRETDLGKDVTPTISGQSIFDDDEDLPEVNDQPGYSPPPGAEDSLRRLFSNMGMDIAEIRKHGFTYQIKNDAEGNAVALDTTTVNLRLMFRFGRQYKDQFRLNKMGQIEEFAGKPMEDRQEIGFKISADSVFGKEIPLERVRMAIIQACADNAYDPLMEFIANLPKWDGVERWCKIPEMIFGVKDNPHVNTVTEKFGLSAMARALRPGCKVDTTLVIQHKEQGWFKSTFAKVLFGEEFFTDQRIDTHDKDSRLLMAQHWCVELGEAELLSTPAKVMSLKQFLSSARDDIRVPYGRRIIKMPRRCVFLATTNEDQLLHDSTGDRRFWFLRPEKPADITMLREWRLQLWAEAREKVTAHFAATDIASKEYLRGQWWLTAEEQKVNDENNISRRYEDAWEAGVYDFLNKQGRRPFMANDVLEALSIPQDRRDWLATKRVTEILMRVGCRRHNEGKPTRVGGRQGRFWDVPDVLPGEEN